MKNKEMQIFLEKILNEKAKIEALLDVLLMDKLPDIADVLSAKESKLKYTEAELLSIEEKIINKFKDGHQHMVTTTIPLGFYLGELCIKKFPGSEWQVPDDAEHPNDLVVNVKTEIAEESKVMIRPFLRATKFLNDKSDRMSSLIHMINFNTEISLNHDYWRLRADNDGWISMSNGQMYRIFSAPVGEDKSNPFNLNNNPKGVFHNGTLKDKDK